MPCLRHIGCIQSFTIRNNAATDILVFKSLCTFTFVFLGSIPKSGVLSESTEKFKTFDMYLTMLSSRITPVSLPSRNRVIFLHCYYCSKYYSLLNQVLHSGQNFFPKNTIPYWS